MKKVVVIGGGITGVGAALALQEKVNEGEPVDYVLIEEADYLGGKIITDEIDGFIIEGGPDCFIAEKPYMHRMAEKLGVEDIFMPSNEDSKGTFIYSDKRLQSLPDGMMLMMPTKILPFALSSLISWPGKFRMAMDLILPRKKEDKDESLGDFVRRRLGQEALDKIAEPLVAGIHSGDPETMSLKASFPRFLQMEKQHGSLIKAMLMGKKAGAKRAPNPQPVKVKKTMFMTFEKGMSQFVQCLVDRIDQNKVLLGKKVVGINRQDKSKGQGYVVKVEGLEPIQADAIILTTPAHDAVKLTQDVDKKLSAELADIPFVSTATISVAYKKADIKMSLKAFGIVIPSKENRKVKGITYSSTKWSKRTPDDDHVLIRVFVGGAKNSELVDLGDQELLALVKSELKVIMGIDVEPIVAKIYRWKQGMPQYVMGHLERVAEIERRVAENPGLYLVGGSYRGVGVGDCMDQGYNAATNAVELITK